MNVELKFDENGLIPVITQDCDTKAVLMLGYMNKQALELTIETGKVHYYSRSRQALWLKGETSGHFQMMQNIRYDCDADAILVLAKQTGVACHTGEYSCFYRSVTGGEADSDVGTMLKQIYNVVVGRRETPVEGSYTNYLLEKGIDKTLKKVGEETTEVVIAAKNEDKAEMAYEIADLMYHLTVSMVQSGVEWGDVAAELVKRYGK